MTAPKSFLYTQLQISVPFAEVPWERINAGIRAQPGFLDKTWLAGVGTHTVGGLYAFDAIEAARAFALEHFTAEARAFGVAQTTRIFDAVATEEASRAMGSVHHGGAAPAAFEAYVYTEVQVGLAKFDDAPWRTLNPVLRDQPGLLSKTWLHGVNGTVGGLYAFATLEQARRFCTEYFPVEAKRLGAAYTTAIFDAQATATASRAMGSPFFAR